MADRIIYTGETDKAKGLSRFQVFRVLPPFLQKLADENPAIAARFAKFGDFIRRRPPGARVRRTPPEPVAMVPKTPIKPARKTKR
jgi:hypothetical protein